MATFESYRTRRLAAPGSSTREVRHLAVVRIRGFKRMSKAFATRRDAQE